MTVSMCVNVCSVELVPAAACTTEVLQVPAACWDLQCQARSHHSVVQSLHTPKICDKMPFQTIEPLLLMHTAGSGATGPVRGTSSEWLHTRGVRRWSTPQSHAQVQLQYAAGLRQPLAQAHGERMCGCCGAGDGWCSRWRGGMHFHHQEGQRLHACSLQGLPVSCIL